MSEKKEAPREKKPAIPKKRTKPDFQRPESWRYKRLKKNWRRPRGLDNKVRKRVKGWPASPNIGYRTKKGLRGIHPSGFQEVSVTNTDDLNKVDKEREAIRIARTVGAKKRTEIVDKAKELGIHVLNAKEKMEIEEET